MMMMMMIIIIIIIIAYMDHRQGVQAVEFATILCRSGGPVI